MKQTQLAIIGSGPAGYAAALYTARAELAPLVFAGSEPGGQLMKTTEIENYPGFAQGIMGPKLMSEMQEQTTRFGAEIVWETVVKISGSAEAGFTLTTDGEETYQAKAVILAMGAKSKLLGVGEERYWGKGFSTCAVCDAAFYKQKNVYVVGGGDAAVEDAWALTKFASSVTMLVRGKELRASKIMQKRALEHPDKIKIIWEANLKAIRGEKIEELVIEVAGKEQVVPAEGLFFAIGHEPATGFLSGSGVDLDEKGYIKNGLITSTPELWLSGYPTMTSVPGIFAAGDCVDFRYRQAATAAGMGVSAALDSEKWLEHSK
jgi:thioredoxin reductase (NADPH)